MDNRHTLEDFMKRGCLGVIVGSPVFMDTEAIKVAIHAELQASTYDGASVRPSDFETIKGKGKKNKRNRGNDVKPNV